MKQPKSAVDFEHPAKGHNYCWQCRHFLRPHGCEKVRGHIDRGDWCKLFARLKTLRDTITEAASR